MSILLSINLSKYSSSHFSINLSNLLIIYTYIFSHLAIYLYKSIIPLNTSAVSKLMIVLLLLLLNMLLVLVSHCFIIKVIIGWIQAIIHLNVKFTISLLWRSVSSTFIQEIFSITILEIKIVPRGEKKEYSHAVF